MSHRELPVGQVGDHAFQKTVGFRSLPDREYIVKNSVNHKKGELPESVFAVFGNAVLPGELA